MCVPFAGANFHSYNYNQSTHMEVAAVGAYLTFVVVAVVAYLGSLGCSFWPTSPASTSTLSHDALHISENDPSPHARHIVFCIKQVREGSTVKVVLGNQDKYTVLNEDRECDHDDVSSSDDYTDVSDYDTESEPVSSDEEDGLNEKWLRAHRALLARQARDKNGHPADEEEEEEGESEDESGDSCESDSEDSGDDDELTPPRFVVSAKPKTESSNVRCWNASKDLVVEPTMPTCPPSS